MNYRMILRLQAFALRLTAILMIPALLISLAKQENMAAIGLGVTMALMLLLSLVSYIWRPKRTALYAREGFVTVALTWIVLSLLGALPFYISGAIPSYVDCIFETVSGFTTTGASILTDVESLPKGLLYWRSFTHWLGGMGVLVSLLAISLFSTGSGDGIFIMRAESTGPQVSKLVPRTAQTARLLYGIYTVVTLIQVGFLMLGGMPLLDAFAIAFGTVGTGGFAIKNDSMISYSPYIQNVVTVFMALCGVNFGIYYLLIMRSFRRAARDEELRFYVLLILAATVIVAVSTLGFFEGDWATTLRHALFQVVSIITSTGYCTVNFELWPQICHTLLMALMIVGACAGSTGGGTKCSRILILFRSLRIEVQRLLHPTLVRPVKMDGKPVPESTVRGVYAFYGVYFFLAVIAVMLVSLDGFDFETTVSAVLTCLNNIGPGFGAVGPIDNFSVFSPWVKLLLSLAMLIGRLEIFPILLLFVPQVWTRRRAGRAEGSDL